MLLFNPSFDMHQEKWGTETLFNAVWIPWLGKAMVFAGLMLLACPGLCDVLISSQRARAWASTRFCG